MAWAKRSLQAIRRSNSLLACYEYPQDGTDGEEEAENLEAVPKCEPLLAPLPEQVETQAWEPHEQNVPRPSPPACMSGPSTAMPPIQDRLLELPWLFLESRYVTEIQHFACGCSCFQVGIVLHAAFVAGGSIDG